MKKDIEKVRNYFKPEKLRILFVGESPPRINFFYQRKGPLYKATKKAFFAVFGTQEDFLKFFKDKGCWLEDLLKERGEKVTNSKSKEIEEGIERISKIIRDEKPETVIIVIKRIEYFARRAIKRSGVEVKSDFLPFPTRRKSRIEEYIHDLEQILDRDLREH